MSDDRSQNRRGLNMINFKELSKPDEDVPFLARVLDGKDAEYQKRVLSIAKECDIDANDPLFLVMLATGQLQVILEDKPKELVGLLERWYDRIQDYQEMAKRNLEEQKHTSLKGLEIEINKTAQRLIQKVQMKEQLQWRVMLPVAGVLLAAIGVGILIGASVPVAMQGGYASGKPRQLTMDEAASLRWAMSREGRLARNIALWNTDSLTNLDCTRNPDQQSYAKKQKGDRASSYCLLRVAPP